MSLELLWWKSYAIINFRVLELILSWAYTVSVRSVSLNSYSRWRYQGNKFIQEQEIGSVGWYSVKFIKESI